MRLLLLLLAPAAALRVPASALREYEKKHGRVAMTAVASLAALSAAGVDDPVRWLSTQTSDAQLTFFAGAAIVEAAATLPRFDAGMRLRADVVPGAFWDAAPSEGAERAEDCAGRAAMLAAVGAMASAVARG